MHVRQGSERFAGRPPRCSPPWRALLLAVVAAGAAQAPALAQTGTTAAQPAAKTTTLSLGATPWSPFTDEPGKARCAIDLVHAALERIGIGAETTIVPEGSLTTALRERRFDGSPALWRDPEREKIYQQLQAIVLEQSIVVPLYYRRGFEAYGPALNFEQFGFVDFDPYGSYHEWLDVWLNE